MCLFMKLMDEMVKFYELKGVHHLEFIYCWPTYFSINSLITCYKKGNNK